jgi:hypothetical protein
MIATLAQGAARPASEVAFGGRRLPSLPVMAMWLALGLANAWFVGWNLYEISQVGPSQTDWEIFRAGATSTAHYAGTDFRWSPLLLGPLTVITTLPFGSWALLHVAAALALPTWPLRLVTLASWPFWQDVSTGNVMVFILIVAVYAARGHRWAALTFWAFAALIPRPLMLPLVIWLLWKREDRGLGLALMGSLFVGGLAMDSAWIEALGSSGRDIFNDYNWGPSAIIGWAWVPVGFALAAWFTWKGRIGLATLFASPYWLPYYMLMPMLELAERLPADD